MATPGRLVHHLLEVPNFSLAAVEVVVFDEADRLFEMGFADQLKDILAKVSPDRCVPPGRGAVWLCGCVFDCVCVFV